MNTIAELISKDQNVLEVIKFKFKLENNLEYIPGQYVMLSFPDDSGQKRAFSIMDYSKEKKILDLGIKIHGDFTKRLSESKIGAKLNLSGPFGRFRIKDQHKKNVFIVGGIGITPVFNMIKYTDLSSVNNYLLYSSRTKKDMPFFEEVSELSDNKIKKCFFFTRSQEAEGKNEHITCESILDVDNSLAQNKEEVFFYICGPNKMIDALRTQLLEKGYLDENIISEEF